PQHDVIPFPYVRFSYLRFFVTLVHDYFCAYRSSVWWDYSLFKPSFLPRQDLTLSCLYSMVSYLFQKNLLTHLINYGSFYMSKLVVLINLNQTFHLLIQLIFYYLSLLHYLKRNRVALLLIIFLHIFFCMVIYRLLSCG